MASISELLKRMPHPNRSRACARVEIIDLFRPGHCPTRFESCRLRGALSSAKPARPTGTPAPSCLLSCRAQS
jgi:hypothetical protein